MDTQQRKRANLEGLLTRDKDLCAPGIPHLLLLGHKKETSSLPAVPSTTPLGNTGYLIVMLLQGIPVWASKVWTALPMA